MSLMVLYLVLVEILPLHFVSPWIHQSFPHTSSQLTLLQPLLPITSVYVLHPVLTCLKIDWANDTTIPHPYLFPPPSPPLCNFITISSTNIFVKFFIGFSIRCYSLNLAAQTLDIPDHVSTTNQSYLLFFSHVLHNTLP